MRTLTLLPLALLLACGDKDVDDSSPAVDADNDGYTEDEDCDDNDPEINPGADEYCDEIDHNCDNVPDLNAVDAPTWYLDGDSDGYGTPDTTDNSCTQRDLYVDNADDCDDRNAKINPGAQEICDRDNEDEDCDGLADDADDSVDLADGIEVWTDADGDGAGDPESTPTVACDPGNGLADNTRDCDDSSADLSPFNEEVCDDGIDNDCSGDGEGCSPTGDAVLSDSWFYLGEEETLTGASVAGAGDADGDGKAEVLVGAPDSLGSGTGKAFLLGDDLSTAITLTGASAKGQAGTAVAGGDVDGDGQDDVVVSAINVSNGDGRVYVVEGPVTSNVNLSAADTLVAGSGGEQLGRSLLVGDFSAGTLVVASSTALYAWDAPQGSVDGDDATVVVSFDDRVASMAAGDLSGSGTDQVWLGLPDANGSAGAVYGEEGSELAGTGGGDGLGGAVASGCDVDGDGVDDLLAGAPTESTTGASAGAAYLLTGSVDGAVAALATATLTGESAGDNAGKSVALADVDADGVCDIVVGAPGADDGSIKDVGIVYVVYGPASGTHALGDADARLLGDAQFVGAGQVANAGDTDDDGSDDLIVGAAGEATNGSLSGAAYLVLGGAW